MKPLLKFLEFGCFSSSTTTSTKNASTDRDIKIKMTTRKIARNIRGIRSLGRIKKPPKPPVSTGRGGQIHST
ncbi:hypothetical protein BVRB_6g139360 [Beta vulgaris subsp. vulgaris]|nr:hypothetical protein BVRB_6g139360 [Beta vulgaris subsp. vulgaris]